MKIHRFALLIFLLTLFTVHFSFGFVDTLRIGKVMVSGYADLYYGYDFNKPENGNHPYAVSASRHARPSVNLTYLSFDYATAAWRIRFAPAAGSYMRMNYAAEPKGIRNIFEANTGFRLSARKNIWFDVGIFGSPFTNESPVSRDQLTYTRSFSAEFVPYYLSGARLSWPIKSGVELNLFALTGWQQIKDQNRSKALATQLLIKPRKDFFINWNTYLGKESSAGDPYQGLRLFNDIYFVRTSGRWTTSSCFYLGFQEQSGNKFQAWWQGNFIARYLITDRLSVSGRLEYFKDKHAVQMISLSGLPRFETVSSSLGINIQLMPRLLYRSEVRFFNSNTESYIRSALPVRNDTWMTQNITWWF